VGDDGAVDSVVAAAIDVADRRGRTQQLRHLATHDPLTSLPNQILRFQLPEPTIFRIDHFL
jgi:GGDEF domain-containing protein